MISPKQFILIEYHGIPYPSGYTSSIREVTGHLDKEEIEKVDAYSLHTEYSYGRRELNSKLISTFPILQSSHRDGVPQLWKSPQWAEEFAQFIIGLVADNPPPEIIEIHPPFTDYTDFEHFIECFKVFESRVSEHFPNTKFFIENRAGTLYHGGRFLVGKASEIATLCEFIQRDHVNLGVVLDFPQLLTAEHIDTVPFNFEKYNAAIEAIYPLRHLIKGIHLWGKKKSPAGRWTAHCGTLDTYFDGNNENKQVFLSGIARICDDSNIRYLVPEVNSGAEDLAHIINDLFSHQPH